MKGAKQITFRLLDRFKEGEIFSGNNLLNSVIAEEGATHYHDTVLRYMRDWRKLNPEFNIINIDKKRSMYSKVKRADQIRGFL